MTTLLQRPETEFDVQKMLDRFLAEAPFLRELSFPRVSFLTPFCDVYEKDGKYFVELSASGYDAKDISVEVTGATVTVNGHFPETPEKANIKYFKRQIPRGVFTRTVTLPQDIDPKSVEATMHNGLLTLALMPIKPIVPQKIAIKSA
ncbi:MAG TPA: Hsp20/alpha crystallin family protein [Candidatus Rubrimentiphilum sp.]|nr:Hsp20/alpha crystallin family protein [Candidatus Rubrimentiphilum sp.]